MNGGVTRCTPAGWSIHGDGDGFSVTDPRTLLEILASLGHLTGTIDLRCPGPSSLCGSCGKLGQYETDERTRKTPHYVCHVHAQEWRDSGVVLIDLEARIVDIRALETNS